MLRWIPAYAQMEKENAQLRLRVAELERKEAEWARFVPPGHFYSPLPSNEEIARAFARGGFGPPFSAVDLNEAGQFARIERFAGYHADQPFPEEPVPGRRFHLGNNSYGHYDAIMLYAMLREAQPRRVIEVGSGFSSAEGGLVITRSGITAPRGPSAPGGKFSFRQRHSSNTVVL